MDALVALSYVQAFTDTFSVSVPPLFAVCCCESMFTVHADQTGCGEGIQGFGFTSCLFDKEK